jgi:glutamate 5-kinase
MRKVVVKIGSSVIAPSGKVSLDVVSRIVRDIVEVEKSSCRVIVVSSGAIACGLNKLEYKKKPQEMYSLMAISSLGQIVLMDIYAGEFKKHRKLCAQILLTWDDFDNRKRFLNARSCINNLLNLGVIPIINENDAVSFEEIRFGDNDRLAALVADLMQADILIILSDVNGLIEDGKVIGVVPKIDSRILRLAKKEDKIFTAGGMRAKLEAAKIATSSGIKTIIANGHLKRVISRLLRGEAIGTYFYPAQKIKEARKRWIAFGKKIKGRVYIDEGAKQAILFRGKSLLSVGIIKVEGDFKKKDAVEVLDIKGVLLGCGLINYSSDELYGVKGKRLEKEVIHRDNFVER